MAEWEKQGIMFGYAIRIRRLKQEDLNQWAELRDAMIEYEVPPEQCVAVEGEDLGECLAAVVWLRGDSKKYHFPVLVWSDADGEGTPITNETRLADSVAFIVSALHPHLANP